MSVDDILNLRAGEPTALFNARNVANRVNLMQRSERQSFAASSIQRAGLWGSPVRFAGAA